MTTLVECKTTDGTGLVRFFFVGDLLEDATFTVNSEATGYEQEATTFEYSLLTDILDGGDLIDDADTADVIQSLDPDELNFGIVDVLLTLDGVPSGGTIAVYSGAGTFFDGVQTRCAGSLETTVSSTDGAADFGLAAGPYCFEGDANGDGLVVVVEFAAAVALPNTDNFVAWDVELAEGIVP